MTCALILCQTAAGDGPPEVPADGYDTVEELYLTGEQQNVQLKLDNLEAKIVANLHDHALGLLVLAAAVYVGDTAVSRGRVDVYGTKWYRELTLCIPVSDPPYWETLTSELEQLLTFLSGDARLRLHFFPRRAPLSATSFLTFPATDAGFQGADTVVLFSGGLDSLAGAVSELASGRTPLLVSHRSVPIRVAAQEVLTRELRRRTGKGIHALNAWVTRMRHTPRDSTQRTRAFLYLSLAAVVASELGMGRILYCENGVTTSNLPLSAQRIGTRSTRTTHPKVLQDFQSLVRKLFGSELTVTNPLLYCTKADVVKLLKDEKMPDLIPQTMSCGRSIGVRRARPHCGTCYQCIVRRFATIAAGAEAHDPVEGRKRHLHGYALRRRKAEQRLGLATA